MLALRRRRCATVPCVSPQAAGPEVGVADGEGVAVGVGEGSGTAVGVGVAVGVGAAIGEVVGVDVAGSGGVTGMAVAALEIVLLRAQPQHTSVAKIATLQTVRLSTSFAYISNGLGNNSLVKPLRRASALNS